MRRGAVLAALLLALLPGCTGPAPAEGADVIILNFEYRPANATIQVGQELVWRNDDFAQHTATAKDGSFGSPNLNQGDVFRHTFGRAGSFAYFCKPHPFMVANVTVLAPV
jgi:plastocyanin